MTILFVAASVAPAHAQGAAGSDVDVESGSSPSTPSPSDQDRSDRARALFAEGVQHAESQAWTRAAEAFEAALALRTAPPIRYNLAAAYFELGRYPEAQEQLDDVMADPLASEDIVHLSNELAYRIRSAEGRISVEVDLERPVEPNPRPTPFYEDWPFWTAVAGGVVALTIIIIGVTVAASDGEDPIVVGNFMPGVITW